MTSRQLINPQPSVYGPVLNGIQDMWDEHNERAQGLCGCQACELAVDFFTAMVNCREVNR